MLGTGECLTGEGFEKGHQIFLLLTAETQRFQQLALVAVFAAAFV